MSFCVVTGGAGLLGSCLVSQLTARQDRVRIVDNFTSGGMPNIADVRGWVDTRMGDICQLEFLIEMFKGADVVFHLAAQTNPEYGWKHPAEMSSTNVDGTLTVLRACVQNKVPRLIFASCGNVYGEGEHVPRGEDFPLRPMDPLAISKLAAERYCLAWGEQHKFDVISLRFFELYGTSTINGAHLLSRIVGLAVAGQSVDLPNAPQTYDFVHAEDAARAAIAASEAEGVGGCVVNIGDGRGYKLDEVVDMLSGMLKRDITCNLVDGKPGYNVANIALAERLLGYVPSIDLKTGLQRMLKGVEDDSD